MVLNKDFLVIFIGKIIQVMITIGTIKISTMLLSPEEMGNIYLFLTVQTFFVFLFISPIGQYINRRTNNWKNNGIIIDNLFIFLIYVVLIAILSLIITYVLYSFFDIGKSFEINSFLFLVFGFILLVSLNQTYIPMLNMLHFRVPFTILSISTSLGVLIFGYLLVNMYYPKAEIWLGAILLSNVISLIFGYYLLNKKTNNIFAGFFNIAKKIKQYNFKSLFIILFPISIATLLMWLQNSGYRLIVEKEISLEFLGYLGVGLAVSSQIASVFESILTQYLSPIYYEKISNQVDLEERKKSFNWLLNIKLPIYFLLTLYITTLAPFVINILVDEKYKDVYIFTIFGIWIEFFRMVTNVFYGVSLSELKTKRIVKPYFLGSILTIILVYLSSIHSEYKLYLPLALIVGGFFTMVIMYFSMKKLIDFEINYRLIFWAFIVSIPYFGVYFIDIESTLFNNIVLVMCFGLYFLGTIFYIYKKGLVNDNC